MSEVPAATEINKTEEGTHEFEFKNTTVGGGLIFEYDPIPEPEAQTAEPEPQPVPTPVPEQPKKAAPPRKTVEEKNIEKDEFTIPDAFAIDSKYDTPATPDIPSRIWTTYVPRFTEASEKYRMKDDPRPLRKVYEQESEPEKMVVTRIETENTAQSEKVDPASPELDPTAELNESTDGVVVNMSQPTRDEDAEQLNVFKFSDPDAEQPSEVVRERTVDDERRDIERLIFPELAPEPEPEPELEPEVIPEPEPPRRAYMIPDPDGGGLSVVDYGKSSHNRERPTVAPEGVSDAPAEMPKRLATEFTHQTQRDSFKDGFLDSLMSIKIRLGAAIVFLLGMIGFELLSTFGAIPSTLFEGTTFTGAVAVVEILFVLSIYAFALPETISSVKRLIGGRLTPEITVSSSLLITVGYLLIAAFGSFDSYPLYGSVFGTLVVVSILSSYFKVNADFTSFKMISQNREKRILDKKMTRALPEENMALDGLVDEYKSRTARIFRAGFITDFFKKTANMAENSGQILKILAISFGISLVVGVVTFFIAPGLLAAVSAAALVFLLGIPAFFILSHKLSYHDAQRLAHSEESTVVGEGSYIDFSDVDVIAFEDTEIFGPDDVNLKRFMLYGDSDNMEQAMRQMCALFGVVGGPLHYIFSNSLDNRMRSTPAANPIIEEDGLSGDVGGKRIAAGTEEYMRRHGVAIPEGTGRAEGGIDTTKIMYASEDGEVYAKFYIRYSFSEEFTMLLPTLKEEKIIPLIYTGDPNVSNELLRMLTAGLDCMRVMKRLTPAPDDDKIYSRVSAGVVTYGDKINAIEILLLSKNYKKFIRSVERAETVCMSIGILAATVLSLVGVTLPALVYAIWQLGCSAVLRGAGALFFATAKDKEKRSKDD